MLTASVRLYGTTIGGISWDPARELGTFAYDPAFIRSGIEVAPVQMPLGEGTFTFQNLARETFYGLPGLLADALPDKFGNLLIDQWLATQGRERSSFNPIERLCYLGNRAMGALEFSPVLMPESESRELELESLISLADDILADRGKLSTRLVEDHEEDALSDILKVGTSAGGARAKAVIAWHPGTGEIRSGQVPLPEGFEPWLIKFDGVTGNRDKELDDPQGYGRIEYAYHLMALEAGVTMSKCHLLEENGRAHFMTRRFDRTPGGDKLHLQSLCALGHYDFNQAGGYSYEQAFALSRRIGCKIPEQLELFRRAAFNIVTRNQDDHTKNISFMMGRDGVWKLAPAYDVTYSYNPDGAWTSRHQMSLNGKRDDFTHEDLIAASRNADVKPRQLRNLLADIKAATQNWPAHAKTAGVPSKTATALAKTFRTNLLP